MSELIARFQWERVMADVARYPRRTFVQYPKHALRHPRDAGARISAGIPRGQIEDFRFPPDHGCRGLHVQEFGDRWEVHIDEVHPACDLIEHLRVDAPGAWMAAGTALGGAIGAVVGRSKNAAAAGAGIGFLLAALFASSDRQRGREVLE